MSQKVSLQKAEFYITNVCNLTCENCNRFNNYKFKGWQAWADYKDMYAQWATMVDLKNITLLGGETLLNPTAVEWISGICELWPSANIEVLTNGYRLNEVKDLYSIFQKYKWYLAVSIHNTNDEQFILDQVNQFLEAPLEKKVYDTASRNYWLIDKNRRKVFIMYDDMFTEAAIQFKDNKFTLHNSDPVQAHNCCPIAQSKSYHFIKGKLYKCGPVALFPDFDKQHTLNLTPEDRELIHSYQPLTLENYNSFNTEFFANLDNPIPQCKFCTQEFKPKKIFPLLKGSNKS